MRAIRFCFSLLTLCVLLASGGAVSAAALTYDAFISKAWTLKVGATRAEIVAALGRPAKETPDKLSYSLVELQGFPGIPGPVGTQVFPGADIPMKNGRMIDAVKWDWVDTTGPAPGSH